MSQPIAFCDECYQASYEWCEDITFVVGLTPSTNYGAVITNHFGQKYTQDVTTDTGGAFTLDADDFPEGFFNPYSGFYTLQVTDANNVLQNLVIAYSEYDCITFEIYEANTAN